MKIASKIHPPHHQPTRTVHVHGRPYVFAPVEDKDGRVHYVAEVNDANHAAVFLGSEHFYELGKEQQRTPALKRAPASEPQPPPAPTQDAVSDAVRAEAKELLAGSASAIATAVAKVSSLAVVRTALTLEREAGGRKNVINLLEATLQFAETAGAKG